MYINVTKNKVPILEIEDCKNVKFVKTVILLFCCRQLIAAVFCVLINGIEINAKQVKNIIDIGH